MTKARFIIFLLAICTVLIAQAQDDEAVYVLVDYMKPLPEKSNDYVKMESDIYKKIHNERINTGEIVAWHLYEVQYPRGTDTEYDYVTVTIFSDFGAIDDDLEEYEAIVGRAHPDKTMDEINKYASDSRKLVRSDVLKSLDRFPLYQDKPAGAILVDFMKVHPKTEDEYVRLEMDIWRPLHKLRHEESQIKSWALFTLQFPGGTNYPYNYATVTGYENWIQIKDSWTEDIFSRVHPNADEEGLVDMTHETRDLYSSEIWKLIDYVQAPPPE